VSRRRSHAEEAPGLGTDWGKAGLGAPSFRAMQQVETVHAPAVAIAGKSWQQRR